MTNWVESIRDHIAANGYGTVGTDLFIGGLADGEDVGDPTSSVVPYGGSGGVETGAPGTAVLAPAIQFAVRSSSWNTAFNRAEAVRTLLDLIVNQTIQGNSFRRVKHSSDVIDMRRDSKGRHQFVVNFDVMH